MTALPARGSCLLSSNSSLQSRAGGSIDPRVPDDFAVAAHCRIDRADERPQLDGLRSGRKGHGAGDPRLRRADRSRQAYFNDEQLRRILNFRTYRGDQVRTCKFQKIIDREALPLIAIREFILARKQPGGIRRTSALACWRERRAHPGSTRRRGGGVGAAASTASARSRAPSSAAASSPPRRGPGDRGSVSA